MSEIAIIGHLADTELAKLLPPELSVASFGVLNHFVRLNVEGESPARLARAFKVPNGAMTYTLQQLEGHGYVSIEADPADARAKIVRITKKGRRARDAGFARENTGREALLDAVGADAFARALPFLIKVREVLDAARD
jgi:DNA-binding MarR family transcriptional regulator